MPFDSEGKWIKKRTRRVVQPDDDSIPVGLESRHPGISDFCLRVALDAVPSSLRETFHGLISQISMQDVANRRSN